MKNFFIFLFIFFNYQYFEVSSVDRPDEPKGANGPTENKFYSSSSPYMS